MSWRLSNKAQEPPSRDQRNREAKPLARGSRLSARDVGQPDDAVTPVKMPSVELMPSPLGVGYIEFRTHCGQVTGTAFRASGCHEAHYDVVSAHRVALTVPPQMVRVSDAVATFDVVGIVTFLFDDGLGVISTHGFTFWIAPDEIDGILALGDHVACRIERLTLYV